MPWNIHYDDDSCALRRSFGEGSNQAYLELRRFQPGFGLQAIVAANRSIAPGRIPPTYRFDDDAEWSEVGSAVRMKKSDGFEGVIFSPTLVTLPGYEALTDPLERAAYLRTLDLRAIEREFAAKVDSLVVRGVFRRELAFQIGSMVEPLAALNACIDELLTHWDIDVEAHKTLTRPAIPVNMAEAGRMVGYPPAMARKSLPGIVNIRLAIDEQGRVTGCHIQMPLSDPGFEESSCADIQHAFEFDPALDKDGKPIPSYWITKIYFQFRR